MKREAVGLIVVGAMLAGCGTDPGAEPLPDPPPEDAPKHVKESWKEAFRSEVERLEAQDPRPDMERVLDGLPLPEGLVLVHERQGVPYCFAGGCPYVRRFYMSDQTVADLCQQTERLAQEKWGLSTFSLGVEDDHKCSDSVEHDPYWWAVSVTPHEDDRPLAVGATLPADAPRTTKFVIELTDTRTLDLENGEE